MADEALDQQLQQWVGRRGKPQVARDPVNQSLIRRWVDVFDDANPCYVDPVFAAASVYGEIISPPTMLDVWDKPGIKMRRDPDSPQANVLIALEAAGFTSTVAVNSELELTRPMHLGEVIQSVQTLEAVSEEKQTGLGRGHFVTTRSVFTNEAGDHVGDVVFRILKFKPGTGRAPAADVAAGPDPDPALRPRPGINRDNQFFWDGARRHELRIQSCQACGTTQFPPGPRCPACGSFDMGWVVASGRATLYSWAAPHHPQANGFRYPVLVGLVALEEGTRLVTNIVGCRRQDLRIGMPLEVCWLDSHPALESGADDSRGPITIPQFRPARPERRTETRRIDEVSEGDELPLCPIPLTTTLIVSCAIATLDWFDAHHDPKMAVARGSKDIFANIHTSLGLSQRWISDWAGPEAVFRNIRVRLGAPDYPGDIMTMTGRVSAVDRTSGTITVSFAGTNSLGDHVTGTAELQLPGGSAQPGGESK